MVESVGNKKSTKFPLNPLSTIILGGAAGGAIGGAIGYNKKSYLKNGEINDKFISTVNENLQKELATSLKKCSQLSYSIANLPEEALDMETLARIMSVPDSTFDPKMYAQKSREIMKKFLTSNAEDFNLKADNDKNLSQVIDEFMDDKAVVEIKRILEQDLEETIKVIDVVDEKFAKDYIKLVLETKDKKVANETFSDAGIKLVKDLKKSFQRKSGLIFGIVSAAIVMGAVTIYNYVDIKKVKASIPFIPRTESEKSL